MASGKAADQSLAMRYLFCRWGHQRQVSATVGVVDCPILTPNVCRALHHDDRLIGFEELGNSDGFETAALELRLQMSGEFISPCT